MILTPADLLTKDDTWINRSDMLSSFDHCPEVVRTISSARISTTTSAGGLPRGHRTEKGEVRRRALREFPELIDCYIKLKEDTGDQAVAQPRKVYDTQALLRDQVQLAAHDIAQKTDLFEKPWTSYDEALAAVETFKHYVENQDGWRVINRGDGKGSRTRKRSKASSASCSRPPGST